MAEEAKWSDCGELAIARKSGILKKTPRIEEFVKNRSSPREQESVQLLTLATEEANRPSA